MPLKLNRTRKIQQVKLVIHHKTIPYVLQQQNHLIQIPKHTHNKTHQNTCIDTIQSKPNTHQYNQNQFF